MYVTSRAELRYITCRTAVDFVQVCGLKMFGTRKRQEREEHCKGRPTVMSYHASGDWMRSVLVLKTLKLAYKKQA